MIANVVNIIKEGRQAYGELDIPIEQILECIEKGENIVIKYKKDEEYVNYDYVNFLHNKTIYKSTIPDTYVLFDYGYTQKYNLLKKGDCPTVWLFDITS